MPFANRSRRGLRGGLAGCRRKAYSSSVVARAGLSRVASSPLAEADHQRAHGLAARIVVEEHRVRVPCGPGRGRGRGARQRVLRLVALHLAVERLLGADDGVAGVAAHQHWVDARSAGRRGGC